MPASPSRTVCPGLAACKPRRGRSGEPNALALAHSGSAEEDATPLASAARSGRATCVRPRLSLRELRNLPRRRARLPRASGRGEAGEARTGCRPLARSAGDRDNRDATSGRAARPRLPASLRGGDCRLGQCSGMTPDDPLLCCDAQALGGSASEAGCRCSESGNCATAESSQQQVTELPGGAAQAAPPLRRRPRSSRHLTKTREVTERRRRSRTRRPATQRLRQPRPAAARRTVTRPPRRTGRR